MSDTKTMAPTKSPTSIYVCSVCGHVEFGSAPANCPVCHAPKEKFTLENTLFTDAQEKVKDGAMKHTPVLYVKKESKLVSELPVHEVSVRVGKTMHPMEEAHHIKFIDFYIDDKHVSRVFLPLSLYPAVSFYIKIPGSTVRAVEWCNLHGYWTTEASLA
jgi:superoxide reductase